MDIERNGKFLKKLRLEKNMTQKQVALELNVVPKTVSKWETGNGFPDVATLSHLAEIYNVSERSILLGGLDKNKSETGNMKKLSFYVCPHCKAIVQGLGGCEIACCGKYLKPLEAKPEDERHKVSVSVVENDLYVEFDHPMTKEHYISFVCYVSFDRCIMVKTYPEQDAFVRIPRIFGGKLLFYCSKDGLFEHK